jgi:roadblock/LC7 domain-containing protein
MAVTCFVASTHLCKYQVGCKLLPCEGGAGTKCAADDIMWDLSADGFVAEYVITWIFEIPWATHMGTEHTCKPSKFGG